MLEKMKKHTEGGFLMETNNQTKLPKNVKQIGQALGQQQVYIEDYVVTYLRQLLEEKKGIKISILYGHKELLEEKLYWFVTGAIEAKTELILDEMLLTKEELQHVERLADRYFPTQQVLGWAVSRNDSRDIYEHIIETQKAFFRSDQKVFFEYIYDEKLENVSLYESGKMILQTGFCIYYDRNECMQNYMVSLRTKDRYPEDVEPDRATRQFREVCIEKKTRRQRQRITAVLSLASLFLALGVLAIGLMMLGNDERMEEIESALCQISEDATDTLESQAQQAEEKWQQIVSKKETYHKEVSEVEQDDRKELEMAHDDLETKTEEGFENQEMTTEGETQKNQETKIEEENGDIKEKKTGTESEEGQEIQTEKENEKGQEGKTEETSEENLETKAEEANGESQEAKAEEESQKSQETKAEEGRGGNLEAKTEKETNIEGQGTQTEEDNQQKTETSTNAQEPVKETMGQQTVYIVKKGDTLDKICLAFYGTLSKRNEICELNSIADCDTILYGQKLILP